jgi:hypothetical protein
MGLPAPPPLDLSTSANYLWTVIDKRIQAAVQGGMNTWGRPRSRTVTLNFPIAGSSGSPPPGWLVSVGIAHSIKIVGWTINAIAPGSIVLDVRVSIVESGGGGVQPAFVSLNGSSNYITHSGFTSVSTSTDAWDLTQVDGGSFLHIYCISSLNIGSAVLALRAIDTESRTLAP